MSFKKACDAKGVSDMKITNNLGLPQAFVSMAERQSNPQPKRYSVTALLKGVREAVLQKRHDGEIEQDVSDMIWLLFGSAAHAVLEQQKESDQELKETKLEIQVGDYTLVGVFDLYNDETGVVTDYKTCSAWKVLFGDYEDWRRQTLVYAWMLRQIGFNARTGEIVAIMKDHSKKDAKFKPDYPKFPVKKIIFEFSEADFAECETWIKEKLSEIAKAEAVEDDQLPLCTLEERYNSGDKYAVMKKGRKTALRVLDSMPEAEAYMAEKGGDEIQVRPGEDKKCKDYCSVCQFCNYYKEVVNNENGTEEAC